MHVCSVMVLKKLGDELIPDFHAVIEYLGAEQGMQVVVEPHEHEKMVSPICDKFSLHITRLVLLHECLLLLLLPASSL